MEGNPFIGTRIGPELERAPYGGLRPARFDRDGFARAAHAAFRELVMGPDFPCLGARAAFNSESYVLAVYDELGAPPTTAALAHDLFEFTRSDLRHASEYATFVAVFRGSEGHASACPGRAEARPSDDEVQFEERLWQQLGALHATDAPHFEWDPHVRSDPTDPQFSFSFAGQALYVIGMHPGSSRIARRFRWPAMIFNPHEQFERLRADGKWKRMQQTIRERDLQLQGSINPMLSDFGQSSEARQYSGRAVENDWVAPFREAKPEKIGKCPFAH